MKVAKQAVQYYCTVTGNQWSDFFERIQEAKDYNGTDDKELWLVHQLLGVITKRMPLEKFIAGKDDIKGVFAKEDRKNAGEFFTPLEWAEEGRKYFDKYIPDWQSYYLWDASCYDMDTEIFIRRAVTKVMDTTGIADMKKVNEGYIEFVSGWVHYNDLKNTDHVLTVKKGGYDFRWVGFYNKFSKPYSGIMYIFESDSGKVLRVTADHIMYVNGERIPAEKVKVNDILVTGTGSKEKVVKISTENVEDELVWDLTIYADSHVFLVRHEVGDGLMSGNCGAGNLLKEAGTPNDMKFLSTLQQDDIDMIKSMPEFEGATAFQLDFLNGLDYDQFNTEFLNKLPDKLQEIIKNDEPMIMYFNPPYKSGMAKATDVGLYMRDIGLGDSAYDLFYQFCWRVMHFVEMFNLTNAYYCFFGPLTFFSGSKAQPLFREFQKCFEFVDGMCIPAQDFSGTSESIDWGIGCTLWKSRGGYDSSIEPKGVLLEKKIKDASGKITKVGTTLYTPPRESISKWLQPADVLYYKDAPLCTSHLTFKGSEVLSKDAGKSGKIAENALGVLMLDDTLARGNSYSAILSLPCTIQFVNITEENFWRCVASFAYRNSVNADWSDSRKWQSAPDVNAEGYDEWLKNSLALFLCELKSMNTGLRGIRWCGDIIDVPNRLFPISQKEIKENCTDSVILEDIETHEAMNEFLLAQLDNVRGSWYPECEELFKWCKAYTLFSLGERSKINYEGSTNAWDAGMAQLRTVSWSDTLNSDLFERLSAVRKRLGAEVSRFGFLSENLIEE